jgi:CRISPR-associated endonuclease/helicase Cas3
MSGDLVLDEPDDFDIDDLPALARLVHWAGLLGSRMLLSSATLPPAWCKDCSRLIWTGGAGSSAIGVSVPVKRAEVCCMWVDEFDQSATQDCRRWRGAFADSAARISPERRHARSRQGSRCGGAPSLAPLALDGKPYDDHAALHAWPPRSCASRPSPALRITVPIDPVSGKRVSFGLIRMANIAAHWSTSRWPSTRSAHRPEHAHSPLHLPLAVSAADPLGHRAPVGRHTRPPIARRGLCSTRDPQPPRRQPRARPPLHRARQSGHRGRARPRLRLGRGRTLLDALTDPARRPGAPSPPRRSRHAQHPMVLDCNLRHFEHPGKAAYCTPGFETEEPRFKLRSHALPDLLEAGHARGHRRPPAHPAETGGRTSSHRTAGRP